LEVEGGRNNDDGSAVDTIDGDRGSGSYYRWKRSDGFEREVKVGG
jgi:hypothetical protein